MNRTLTIRADCSSSMGTGHVMRMIALGQAWQALGGHVQFVGQTAPLDKRLKAEGFDCVVLDHIHPEPEDAQILLTETNRNNWIAIDGYHFDTDYQKTIRERGRRTLVLDDFFDRGQYVADILLNQNPDGPDYPYSMPGTILLLGTKYTLLRKEFQRPTIKKNIPAAVRHILVTLGGADPDNVTGKVLEAIETTGLTGLDIKIVAGAANPHIIDLQKRIESLPCSCELLTAVDDMPGLMTWADLAVSAGGTTCWEMCYFGVPFIAIEIADNQQGVIRELNRHGAARCLDRAASVGDIATEMKRLIRDRDARQSMHQAGTRLVDGKGALRVAKTMFNSDICLRPVKTRDCDMLHSWRNTPETRANSFSTEEIPLETHRAWFENKLHDDGCLFFIAIDDDEPVGQIRFDRQDSEAVISVSVAPTVMNRGIGTVVTRLGCVEMTRQWPGVAAVALVKPDNPASASMFTNAGFAQDASTNSAHLRFVWSGNTDDA